jgi:hypothetical protein
MKSLSTKMLLASVLLTTVFCAEAAHAYSNVVAGSHPEASAQRFVGPATPAAVNRNRLDLSVKHAVHRSHRAATPMRLDDYRQTVAAQALHR